MYPATPTADRKTPGETLTDSPGKHIALGGGRASDG